MSLLTPSAWEGVSVVTVVVIFFIAGVFSLMRGWIVFGPAHREITRALSAAAEHSNDREKTDAETIAKLTNVIVEQRVAGEMSAHMMQAIREATQSITNTNNSQGSQ